MILSIGMIVKNEEKYLEKCLTALKPILENVDSELIIADTGSTDNTVEIAKKFTDNVFHFEWINDFAAARNSTLDKAKGEWYMFIDADEIIQDCSDLINFFNSGEYKKYGSANYVQRNYNDLQNMDLYSDFKAPRLTALINGVRFAKAIHENFTTIFTPVKYLNLVVDHYGYVYKDGAEETGITEKKTTRNLELLFKELEEGEKTGNVVGTVYGQIADCYIWRGDLDNALKYVDMGLEKVSKTSYLRLSYYGKKAKILAKQKKFEEVIEICKEYFSNDNAVRKMQLAADCDIYFFWATAAYNLQRYDEAIAKAAVGFDVYKKYINGKLNNDALIYCSVEATIPQLKQISNILAVSCSKEKKFNIANDELNKIPLKDFMSDSSFMKIHLGIRIEVMEQTNYNKLSELYFQLDKPNRELCVDLLLSNVFKTGQRTHFLKKLAPIADDNERLADILTIFNSYFVDRDLSSAQVAEFIKKHGTIGNETILIMMMQKNRDIAPFVCAEDFDPVKCVSGVFGDFLYLNLAAEPFEKYLVNKISENSIGIAAKMYYQALITMTEKKLSTTKLIINYGNLGRRWTELNPEKEPDDSVSFALIIGEIAELYRRKHYNESIERLTELVGDTEPSSDSDNTKILRHLLAIIKEEEEKSNEMRENQDSNPAMAELAAEIKESIRDLIDHWDLDGAEEALNQMAKMAPFDPDIEDIRDEIIDRKVNYMKYM